MRKLALLIGGLALLMLPGNLTPPDMSVQVRDESGEIVICLPANPGDSVLLQFTHSMYGGYVRETWRILPNQMLERVRFATENAASAEYYATDGSSYRAEDGYVVPTDPLTQTELVVRVNARGNHILTVGDRPVNLAEAFDTSAQVRIVAVSESCPESAMSGTLERTHSHARSVREQH